jgi:hypothetical protein
MTSFSFLLLVCIGLFFTSLLYIFWLLRSGKIISPIAVKWIFLDIIAIIVILGWGRLPFIRFTRGLSDREMLVLLACIFFVFLSLVILECMILISKQTNQIRHLAQELALLKLRQEQKEREEVR